MNYVDFLKICKVFWLISEKTFSQQYMTLRSSWPNVVHSVPCGTKNESTKP